MSNRNEEEMREWYQEMRDEAREEEYLEHRIRNDFDYFCDSNEEAIEQLNEAINDLRNQCEHYGYEFDINDFIY